MAPKRIGVYILSKNEQENIGRCLSSLSARAWDVFLLDSGSTDETFSIAQSFNFVKLVNFDYKNHCQSYNEILTSIATGYDYVLVLDADMIITPEMYEEIELKVSSRSIGNVEAFVAPVSMWVEGVRLSNASLYPPKPFFFKTGKALFESVGHGEKLKEGINVEKMHSKLVHDDRKDYFSFLSSQYRYSRNLLSRGAGGMLNWRDRLRLISPVFVFVTPLYSYIWKMGFMDGRAGLVYALDRLIAEAVMYRQSLAKKISKNLK